MIRRHTPQAYSDGGRVEHEETALFRDVAAEFLACIDAAADRGADQTMRAAAAILASLYSAACGLPLVEPGDEDASDGTESDGTYDALYRRLGDAGVGGYYWDIAPFLGDAPGDQVVGDLADDLVDIYLDLRRGFAILDVGGPIRDAVWEWRFSFEVHWGKHTADALRGIPRPSERRARRGEPGHRRA